MDEWNKKNAHLRKQNNNLYILNKKLVLTSKNLKKKIVELKERYNRRIKRAQKYGVDVLEMTIPRWDTDMTYDYSKDEFGREYIDDFNSNDSYELGKTNTHVVAYKNSGKSRTLLIDEGDDRRRLQTDFDLKHNDYHEFEELTSDKINSLSKKSSQRKDKSLNGTLQSKTIHNPLNEEIKEEFGVKKPNFSFKKKGLITKVHLNNEARDLLAGRRKVIKKPQFNKVITSPKYLNKTYLEET